MSKVLEYLSSLLFILAATAAIIPSAWSVQPTNSYEHVPPPKSQQQPESQQVPKSQQVLKLQQALKSQRQPKSRQELNSQQSLKSQQALESPEASKSQKQPERAPNTQHAPNTHHAVKLQPDLKTPQAPESKRQHSSQLQRPPKSQQELNSQEKLKSQEAPKMPEPPKPTESATSTAKTVTITEAQRVEAINDLRKRDLLFPIRGFDIERIKTSYSEMRGNGPHEASDILAPRGTEIMAVDNGSIASLFLSKLGGITIYQFDPQKKYIYYYAHLERYAPDLKVGDAVSKGQVIGYVGTSGDAPKNTPHLHLSISVLGPRKEWWHTAPIDPYLVFRK